MRILLPALPVLLGFLLPSVSRAEWPQFPFVHAEGEAEMHVPPDEATVRFSVTTFDKESAVGLEVLQSQIRKALELLSNAGVPEEGITGFDLQKIVERSRDDDYNELEILGYYFSRDFEVELTDLEKFSPLVAELMALDHVSPVNAEFDIGTRDELESKLVQQAGEDARRRAEDLARSMGVSIESVFAISATPLGSVGPTFGVIGDSYETVVTAYRRAPSSQDTIFIPETIELRKSVNVLFKLQEQ